MAERTPERLLRLLGLVTYLDGRSGVPVEEVARHFGVSTAQVLRDIDTLWVTGTPGYLPDDLIDFDADSLEAGVVRMLSPEASFALWARCLGFNCHA